MRFDLYRWHLFRDLSRFSYVLYLIVPYGMIDDKPVMQYLTYPTRYRFTDVLHHFNRLQFLDLTMGCDDLNPTVYNWIISLKDLRGLKFREIGPVADHIVQVLEHLNPQMDLLHLDQPRMRDGFVLDPLPLLQAQPCVATLTGLLVEAKSEHAGPHIPANGAPFARVHTLVWHSATRVETVHLMRAFPALRRLGITVSSVPWSREMLGAAREDAPSVLDVRLANADAQRRAPAARWDGLERAMGDLLTLWSLALRCPVDAIETEINAEREARIGAKMGHLLGLMHDVTPREITVLIRPSHINQLERVLVFPTLRRLDVTVRIYAFPDILDEIKGLFERIEVSPLQRLRIAIKPGSGVRPSRFLPVLPLSARGHRVIKFLRTKMPDIEEITIDLWPRWKEHTWKRGESDVPPPDDKPCA